MTKVGAPNGSTRPLFHDDTKRPAQDGRLLLSQIVRPSTAAPTYFEPEEIVIHSRDGSAVEGAFVDGGVTPFNDPALQLLMLAALQGHGFRWATGPDWLLIVSVGTGSYQQSRATKDVLADPAALQGITALQSLLDDCDRMNRATLQWLTNCLTLADRQRGRGHEARQRGGATTRNLCALQRAPRADLESELGLKLLSHKIEQLRKMDAPSNLLELADLGRRAAAKQVRPEQMPAHFDPPAQTA